MYKKALTLINFNANGLRRQLPAVTDFLARHEADIICITETFLRLNDTCNVAGYSVFRTARIDGPRGGTEILIKRNLQAEIDTNTSSIENTTIITAINGRPTRIAAVYSAPSRQIEKIDLTNIIKNDNIITILIGDFNALHDSWNNHSTSKGLKLATIIGELHSTVHAPLEPTRYAHNGLGNTLDIAISFGTTYSITSNVIFELNSDHFPVKMQLEFGTVNPPTARQTSNKRTLWHRYKYYIENANSDVFTLTTNDDIDAAVQTVTAHIQAAVEKSTITTTNKPYNRLNLPTWIRNKLKNKYAAKKRWSKYHRPEDKRIYDKLTAETKTDIAVFKEESWNNFITNIEEEDQGIWKLHKILRSNKDARSPLFDGQRWLFKPIEQAEHAADFFAQQFKNTRVTDPVTNMIVSAAIRRLNDDTADDPIVVTTETVVSHLKAAKTRKAAGPDRLTNKALKLLPPRQIEQITTIFNACFRNNYFPAEWKKANIITIPKKDKTPSIMKNLRPISLLSSLGKLFERIILEELKNHLEENKLLPGTQFGFRRRLCATAQATHLDIIARQRSTVGQQSLVALIDVEKAFDSVWRDAILYKAIEFKIPTTLIKLIQSFLTDRTFRIKRNSHYSSWKEAEEGVPQGATMSPLLFNVAVANPPALYGRNCSLHQFADDIAILSRGYRNYSSDKHETNLNRIGKWLQKWRLQGNPAKTEIVNLGRKALTHNYVKFDNTNIKIKEHANYLGVTFQRHYRNRPRWTRHCNQRRNIARKTFRQLYSLL